MTLDLESPRQRLPYDATTLAQATQYFETRARQLLHEHYLWSGSVTWVPGMEQKACQTHFVHKPSQRRFNSFYVLAPARGQGLMSELVTQGPIVTTKACGIEDMLTAKGADFQVVGPLLNSVEYGLIQAHYGDKTAERTPVFLMDHIDEGMAVMRLVGASDQAIRAFCLHPLLQNDADLAENFDVVAAALSSVDDGALTKAYAMEYRSIANEYLAKAVMPAGGIRLSPLEQVNLMLCGDKVQNRAHFHRSVHAQTHPNRLRLAEYFEQWCARLGLAPDEVDVMTQAITLPVINSEG